MPFVVALGLAWLLTPIAGNLGRALGLVDSPGEFKIHPAAVPVAGGIAVVVSTGVALAVSGASVEPGLVIAVAISLLVGAIDDARPLSPRLRVAAQICSGLALAAGVRGDWPGPLLVVVAVALVLACTNGVNLIDGQDGLAGGLAAIAATALAFLIAGEVDPVLLALGGALAGFVVWNRPPARIFLGNGGAYAVGTFLASGAAEAASTLGFRGLSASGLCLGIFAFELAFTVGRRIRSRDGLARGDRSHSYDLLSRSHPRALVTVAFWLAGACVAVFGLAVSRLPLEAGSGAVAIVCACAGWAGHRLWSMHAGDARAARSGLS